MPTIKFICLYCDLYLSLGSSETEKADQIICRNWTQLTWMGLQRNRKSGHNQMSRPGKIDINAGSEDQMSRPGTIDINASSEDALVNLDTIKCLGTIDINASSEEAAQRLRSNCVVHIWQTNPSLKRWWWWWSNLIYMSSFLHNHNLSLRNFTLLCKIKSQLRRPHLTNQSISQKTMVMRIINSKWPLLWPNLGRF